MMEAHELIARHFMKHKGYSNVEPFEIEQLDDQPCWYFYYRLPQGVLELEVAFSAAQDDWEVRVTGFPVDL